jgi:hypothetical protein
MFTRAYSHTHKHTRTHTHAHALDVIVTEAWRKVIPFNSWHNLHASYAAILLSPAGSPQQWGVPGFKTGEGLQAGRT